MKKLFSIPLNWQVLSIWAILLLSFLGQFARLDSPLGRVSLHELLMLPVILAFFWKYRASFQELLKSRLVWLTGAFLLWTTLTTSWNAAALQLPELLTEGFAYLSRLGLYLAFAAALFLWGRSRDFSSRALLEASYIWLLLQALVGIGQFLLFPDSRLLFYLGWDDHLSRAFGTLLDPGFFGLFMVFGALLSFSFALQFKGQKKRLSIFALAFCMSALALSYSRASYVAFVVAVMVLSFLWKQRSVLLLIPLLVLCIVLLPKDGGGEGQNLLRTRSIEAREEVLEYHTQGISTRELIIGRGWYYESALAIHEKALQANNPEKQETSVRRNNAQAVDNVYLHMLFSTGIIGTIFFAAWLCLLLWQLRYYPELLAAWAAVLVHSLFSTALLYSWCLLILASLTLGKSVRSQRVLALRETSAKTSREKRSTAV